MNVPTMTEIKRIKGETTAGRLGQILYARDVLGDLKVKSICDVGCAEGYFLAEFACPEKHGLEVDPYALAHAVPGVSMHSDWSTVPEVQLVTLIDVIEHLNPTEVFDCMLSIREHLHPGGWLFVQTDNPRSLVTHYTHYSDFSHARMYGADLLAAILEFYRFSIVKSGCVCSHQYNRKPITHFALKIYRKLKYGPWIDPCDRYWFLAQLQ